MMKKLFIRLLCAVLALSLPVCALAEEVSGYAFDLTIEMNAEAYPDDAQDTMEGIAELLNIVRLQGTLAINSEGQFDLPFELTLNDTESTRTAFRLYGLDSHYVLTSSLLGTSKLMINNLAMLEFAMKTYNYLDIPLQYPALLESPYIHTSAFEWVQEQWQDTFFAEEGDRVIEAEAVTDFAAFVQEEALADRTFFYWLDALTNDIGYEGDIMDAFESVDVWVEDWLDEDGIVIETDEDGYETWTSGDWTLFTQDASGWALTLPGSYNQDYVVSAVCQTSEDTTEFTLEIGPSGEDAVRTLQLVLTGVADELPMNGDLTLTVSAADPENELALDLAFTLSAVDGELTLTQTNTETEEAMLTITVQLEETTCEAEFQSESDILAELSASDLMVNVLSVNDNSLNELLKNVKDSFMSGFVPLLLQVPGDSYACLLDLMEEYGVLDMLTIQN